VSNGSRTGRTGEVDDATLRPRPSESVEIIGV
jgi:hypothetical protein